MQNHTTTNRPHTRPTCTAGVTTLTVSMSYTPFSASLVTVSWIMVLLLGWKRLQKNTFKSKFASNAEVLELERIGVYHTIRTGHCKLTKLNHSLEEVQILFHVEYEGCHFHHDKMTSVLVKTPNWNRTIPWNTSSLHNSLHTRAHTHTHTPMRESVHAWPSEKWCQYLAHSLDMDTNWQHQQWVCAQKRRDRQTQALLAVHLCILVNQLADEL